MVEHNNLDYLVMSTEVNTTESGAENNLSLIEALYGRISITEHENNTKTNTHYQPHPTHLQGLCDNARPVTQRI